MSLSLERLRALQRQAGRADAERATQPDGTHASRARAVAADDAADAPVDGATGHARPTVADGARGVGGLMAVETAADVPDPAPPPGRSNAAVSAASRSEEVAAPGRTPHATPAVRGRGPSLQQLHALRRQAGQVTNAAAMEHARTRAADTATASRPAAPAHVAASPPVQQRGPRSVLDWIDAEAAAIRPAGAPPSSRHVAPTTVPAAAASASMSPPALRGSGQDIAALRRLIGLRERQPASSAASCAAPASMRPTAADRGLPGREIAPGLHLIEAFLPQPLPHGTLSLAFAKRPDDVVRARDLLFFDTETTGLAGGTGTRAFMVGAADWHVDEQGRQGLRIRQLLMATMAAETAMLRTFADWLTPRTVLSSYNGRCYDAPLLKTRFRLARMPEPLGGLDHVDLLFPTRRRYRGSWENCRLATVERRLLGIVREDDLPGSEAPAAWLTFLRGGSARNLCRVGEHNHQDVVTLATLFQRLVAVEEEERAVLALQDAS